MTEITAVQRVQPAVPTAEPTTTFLSIVDNTVATYGVATALWIFNPREKLSIRALSTSLFPKSLSVVLSAYPHFAGQLGLTTWSGNELAERSHRHRFRRTFVQHGYNHDPGVRLELATVGSEASHLFPEYQARTAGQKVWDVTDRLYDLFSPSGDLPLKDLITQVDTPSVQIRITILSCQSVVIVPRLAHPLADAETMIAFMKSWGQVHESLKNDQKPPLLVPIFDPSLLDARARGNIDAPVEDRDLVEESMGLPLPRFDWWKIDEDGPSWIKDAPQAKLPADIPAQVLEQRRHGRRIPWEEWDLSAAVDHKIFHFSRQEVEWLFRSALHGADCNAIQVSRHDVVLAFIWHLVTLARSQKARQPTDASTLEDLCWFDQTIGLRPRLALPHAFVGSPVLLAGLSAPRTRIVGSIPYVPNERSALEDPEVAFPDISAVSFAAKLIRGHISKFDRGALGAWLHEQAYEIAPQRWWNGFLGSHHLLATSWVRSGLWEVDFGFGFRSPGLPDGSLTDMRSARNLRWAGVIGPNLDGLTTIAEAEGDHGREWWLGGVDVDMKLEAGAMANVVDLLQSWRKRKP